MACIFAAFSMLTLSQVSKAFAGRTLFSDVSLQVNRGDRIGLVGPNGAGKSTLFSLILGEASPDTGRVMLEKSANMGFLPQESAPAGDETVLELACATSPEMMKAQRIIKAYESAHSSSEGATPGTPSDEDYHEALATFDELGGWQLEPKAKQILHGLAFREVDFDRQARTMSGGWIMRAHLARLLVMEPDLLLLDEPTNHLDLESLYWFQDYLSRYPGAILMISHDREFLNALVGSIVEIAHSKLNRYRGNWDKYVVEKAAREEQQLAAYKNQQKEIASLQEFADRFRAKASKASQAQSKLKQIDRMEKIEAPLSQEKTVHMRFPQPPRSGIRAIEMKGIDFSYGDLTVYRGLNFEAERGQRTVLVGPNGAGKSTLLKLLAGNLKPQAGTVEPGYNVKVGYFSQHRMEGLKPKSTVLESVQDMPNPPGEQMCRTVLGSFLFRGDDVFKPVGVLSGGEKTRLALVKLLLDPPNLLLMDEPTTHLDIGSIDALINALQQYEGTLIFISHDVHFIRAMAKTVLHISAGKLTPYAGDYDYYLEKSKATSAREALTAGEKLTNFQPKAAPVAATNVTGNAPTPRKSKEQKRAEAEARQAQARVRKEHETKVASLEMQIATLEGKQRALTAELENPDTYESGGRAVEINRDLMAVSEDLARLTKEWEALAATAPEDGA
ncbi:ABC transporter-related protein [Chthoniobacter flavus Ellin428]|uniref:ABC transporter-related protein n=1 Tax=Chthoniobacter flavus Ellin428 TaxID=497964 RepID=B4CZL1_9BACT|nr:ABC-F family ATP-binding cassette domain-containing protein [Chthoniobacter flavus]EDY20175.1 ABC transporter-related protein [Chthoniobacter flavus Ellin428]TCO94073.1 ATP-binding cassette subfamily F protein 3 [Chthoniobacter flavus]